MKFDVVAAGKSICMHQWECGDTKENKKKRWKKKEKLEAEMKMVAKQRESQGETNSLIHNL